jgi:hypothetical protein
MMCGDSVFKYFEKQIPDSERKGYWWRRSLSDYSYRNIIIPNKLLNLLLDRTFQNKVLANALKFIENSPVKCNVWLL